MGQKRHVIIHMVQNYDPTVFKMQLSATGAQLRIPEHLCAEAAGSYFICPLPMEPFM